MDWKYIKEISDRDLIEVEAKLNIILSDKLKEIILCYNNGRPQKKCFDTLTEKGKKLKKILSYNKEDKDNVYIFSELITKGYVPFAITDFGDVICESKEETIYLYKHESDEFEYITENIRKFINEKLY